MGVAVTQTFSCDATGCNKSSTEERDFAWVSISYRLGDGSSGVIDKHFCPTHENKMNGALRPVGLLPDAAPPKAAEEAPQP